MFSNNFFFLNTISSDFNWLVVKPILLLKGDSGGPLSIPGDKYLQIGVVSFGSTLGCESGAPAGFSEVAIYADWISSVTGLKIE